MRKRLFLTALLLLPCLVAQTRDLAHGVSAVSTDHATVTLLSERTHAEPGQTLWLGLRFELIPHWEAVGLWGSEPGSGRARSIYDVGAFARASHSKKRPKTLYSVLLVC